MRIKYIAIISFLSIIRTAVCQPFQTNQHQPQSLIYYVDGLPNQNYLIPYIETCLENLTYAGYENLPLFGGQDSIVSINGIYNTFESNNRIDSILRRLTGANYAYEATPVQKEFLLDLSSKIISYDKFLQIIINPFNELIEYQFVLYKVRKTTNLTENSFIFSDHSSSNIFINPREPSYKSDILYALKQVFSESNTPPTSFISTENHNYSPQETIYIPCNHELSFTTITDDNDSPSENIIRDIYFRNYPNEYIPIKRKNDTVTLIFKNPGIYRFFIKTSDKITEVVDSFSICAFNIPTIGVYGTDLAYDWGDYELENYLLDFFGSYDYGENTFQFSTYGSKLKISDEKTPLNQVFSLQKLKNSPIIPFMIAFDTINTINTAYKFQYSLPLNGQHKYVDIQPKPKNKTFSRNNNSKMFYLDSIKFNVNDYLTEYKELQIDDPSYDESYYFKIERGNKLYFIDPNIKNASLVANVYHYYEIDSGTIYLLYINPKFHGKFTRKSLQTTLRINSLALNASEVAEYNIVFKKYDIFYTSFQTSGIYYRTADIINKRNPEISMSFGLGLRNRFFYLNNYIGFKTGNIGTLTDSYTTNKPQFQSELVIPYAYITDQLRLNLIAKIRVINLNYEDSKKYYINSGYGIGTSLYSASQVGNINVGLTMGIHKYPSNIVYTSYELSIAGSLYF